MESAAVENAAVERAALERAALAAMPPDERSAPAAVAIGSNCNWQQLQLAAVAIGSSCNWQQLQLAAVAIGSNCNWQQLQLAAVVHLVRHLRLQVDLFRCVRGVVRRCQFPAISLCAASSSQQSATPRTASLSVCVTAVFVNMGVDNTACSAAWHESRQYSLQLQHGSRQYSLQLQHGCRQYSLQLQHGCRQCTAARMARGCRGAP